MIGERLPVCRARLAAQTVCVDGRHLRNQVGMPENLQDRGHQQVGDGEPVLEVVASVEPIGEVREPLLRGLDRLRPAQLRPFRLGLENIDLDEVANMRLDRIHRREEPRRRTRPFVGIGRHQRFRPPGDMVEDRTGFEEHQPVFLIDRHLPEGLQTAIVLGRPVLEADLPDLVGKAGLFQRPPEPQVAAQTLGERRHPAERGKSDHAVTPSFASIST